MARKKVSEDGMGASLTKKFFAASCIVLSVAACSSGEERVFQGGANETKPTSNPLIAKRNADLASPDVVGTFSYAIVVSTTSGVNFDGVAKVDVLSDFSLRTTEANLQIGSMKLDLKSLTQRLSLDFFKDAEQNISRDNGIIYVRDYVSARFDPPRPLFIGPIVRNVDRFKNLKKTSSHTVTVDDGDQHYSGKGSFTLEVLETKGFFKSSKSPKDLSYENVLHWRLTSSGFEEIPSTKAFNFRKVEWWYSTSPLGVVKLAITGDLGDLLKQGGKNQKAIVGEVTITMEITDQAF